MKINTTCDTCGRETEENFVYALPGIPLSVGACRRCTEANAYPFWVLVGNTAAIGGMDHAAEWWHEVVEDSLRHLGKTREEFDQAVEEADREDDPQP